MLVVSPFFLVGRVHSREENGAITSLALWPDEAASGEPQRAATGAAAQGRTFVRSTRLCEQHFDIWPRKGQFSKPPFMDPTHRSSKQKKNVSLSV